MREIVEYQTDCLRQLTSIKKSQKDISTKAEAVLKLQAEMHEKFAQTLIDLGSTESNDRMAAQIKNARFVCLGACASFLIKSGVCLKIEKPVDSNT